jgi:hypothetical protein
MNNYLNQLSHRILGETNILSIAWGYRSHILIPSMRACMQPHAIANRRLRPPGAADRVGMGVVVSRARITFVAWTEGRVISAGFSRLSICLKVLLPNNVSP